MHESDIAANRIGSEEEVVMVRCHRCGIDPDKVTSGMCMCPIQTYLCTCGQFVRVGEAHYHVVESDHTY
jgi:hypothetical protein